MQVDYGLEDWSSRQPLCAKFCLLQETKDNWIKPLLTVGLSLQKHVCSAEVLISPWLLLEVSFILVVTAVLTLLRLRDATELWSRRWVHHVSISVQGLAPQNTEDNWIQPLLTVDLSLHKLVCALLIFYLYSWLRLLVICFGCAHSFDLVNGWRYR